ncbi:hypothetical protein ACFSL4_36660 [Streptomyces caeni]|uniref:Uncharacterized protein n=1 Tax=Streptomyces caeni TaxID=2307231 RepID=A0ABW4J1P6_9ACTN
MPKHGGCTREGGHGSTRRGLPDTPACCFAALAVPGGETLTGRQEELAWAVLEAVLPAGLPPYDIEAAADGEERGVALVPEGHRTLRAVWQQDRRLPATCPWGWAMPSRAP